jgi:phage FluMu protein Com
MSLYRDIRCLCHRLLGKVSSTSAGARLEMKCPRCSKITTFTVTSTGVL